MIRGSRRITIKVIKTIKVQFSKPKSGLYLCEPVTGCSGLLTPPCSASISGEHFAREAESHKLTKHTFRPLVLASRHFPPERCGTGTAEGEAFRPENLEGSYFSQEPKVRRVRDKELDV